MDTASASAIAENSSPESKKEALELSQFASIPGIQEVAIAKRQVNDVTYQIAYLVASQQLKPEDVSLQGVDDWAQVSALPLVENGQVDESVLTKLIIPFKPLIDAFRQPLENLEEIDSVIDVVVPNKSELPRFHLYDFVDLQGIESVEHEAEFEEVLTETAIASELPDALIELPISESQKALPQSLVPCLFRAAEIYLDERFIYLGAESVQRHSFAQLLEDAKKVAGGILESGMKPGEYVIIHMADIQQTLTAFWGALVAQCVPVITSVPPVYSLDSNEVIKLKNTWQLLGKSLVVADADVYEKLTQLNLFENSNSSTNALIMLDELTASKPVDVDADFAVDPDDVAFICLSSGSTGIPKCIQMTHRNVIARARGANELFKASKEDVILNWLPFDHIGSISDWHIRCIDLGCTMVYCDKDRVLTDPLEWIHTMNHYRISHTWAPNFAYASVNSVLRKNKYGHKWDLSCVKVFLTAAESVSGDTTNEFLALLSPYGLAHNSVRPAFGMAEMGSGVTYVTLEEGENLKEVFVDRDSLKGHLQLVGHRHPNAVPITSLGPLISGMSMRIVDEQNNVLPESTVGKLHMKGVAVTPGYYKNEEANKVFLNDGWMDTGDKGFIINGELYLSGRTKDTLVLNGANYLPIEIEKVTESLPGVEVSFTAATSVKPADDNRESLALFFTPSSWNEFDLIQTIKAIREKVAVSIGISPNYLVPLEKERIPKTAIGKIQRSKLVNALEAGEFSKEIIEVDHLLKNDRTLPDWFAKWQWVNKSLVSLDTARQTTWVFVLEQNQKLPESFVKHIDHYACLILCNGIQDDTLPSHIYRADFNNPKNIESVLLAIFQENGENPLCVMEFTLLSESNYELDFLLYRAKNLAVSLQNLSGQDKVDSFRALVYEQEKAPNCYHFSVGSFYRSAMSDLSIDKKVIDICLNENISLSVIQALVDEFSQYSVEEEIALFEEDHKCQRMVRHLLPYDFNLDALSETHFPSKSLVVILGGFGGVGFELSQLLLKRFDVTLRVVGRTPLSDPGNRGARVKGILNELKAFGDIEYLAADVADASALEQLVQQLERDNSQALFAIFHLAGMVNETPISEQSLQDISAGLHAKVSGGWTVDHLLQTRPHARAIYFSSTLSVLPSSIAPVYSAANRFLDDLSLKQRLQGKQSYSIAWSAWKGLGMSSEVNSDNGLKAQGLYGITPKFGMLSMNLILGGAPENVMVGVARDSNLLCSLNSAEISSIKSFGFAIEKSTLAKVSPSRYDYHAFNAGDSSGIKVVEYAELPKEDSSEIDLPKIRHHLISQGGDEIVKPETDIENTLYKIWVDVLKMDEFGTTDNFFALGGQSLAAAKLVSEINTRCHADFPVSFVFEASTIKEQAALIESDEFEDTIEIIPLQPEGKAHPIFCLCGVELYSEMATHFAGEIPVYGAYLPIEGRLVKNSKEITNLYVKDMAQEYITAIKQIQVKGPYRLLGVSFGCVIAFEVARQLEAAGEKVELVVFIDFVLPEPGINQGIPLSLRQLKFFAKQWRSKFNRKWCDLVRSLPNIGPNLIKDPGPTRVNRAYQSAWERYQKEITVWPNPDKFIVFRASDEPKGFGYSAELDCGWSQYIGGKPESHLIKGSHLGILRGDGAKEIVNNVKNKIHANSLN